MAYAVTDIIEWAKISQPLALVDGEKKLALTGESITPDLDMKIYTVRKSVEWEQSLNPSLPATNATASITITDVGDDGDEISVAVNDPVYGTILLGSYVKQTSDTTPTILAASIAAVLSGNSYSYGATSTGADIIITSRNGLGTQMNTGNRLIVTIVPFSVSDLPNLWGWYIGDTGVSSTPIAEINAHVTAFSVAGMTGLPIGTLITITANQPSGILTIGTYTTVSGDNVSATLCGHLVSAINSGGTGYSSAVNTDPTRINVDAASGLGNTMNGRQLLFAWSGGSTGTNFNGGQNAYNSVSSWADQSGGGNDLNSVIGYKAGTSTINSFDAVANAPAGLNSALRTSGNIPSISDFVVFMVASQDSDSLSTDNANDFYKFDSNGSLVERSTNLNEIAGFSRSYNIPSTISVANDTLYSIRLSNLSNVGAMTLNNITQVTVATSGSTFSDQFVLFDFTATGNKKIVELIIVAGSLTALQISATEQYLNNKYSLY